MNEEVVDTLDEYDFGRGEIGKYAARYADGTSIVLLDVDVAKMFPDSYDEDMT